MPHAEAEPRWLRLWAGIGAPTDAARRAWTDLASRYSEPWRAYHTLEHVLACQRELDDCRHLALDGAVVEAALWFHDAVYDPRASGNEEASAALAKQVLTAAGMTSDRIERVAEAILATKHAATADDADAALVADIDLAILGASQETFDHYEELIRREYSWVPEAVFRERRAGLLEAFLAREHLFNTPSFCERLESRARANLARSVAALREAPFNGATPRQA